MKKMIRVVAGFLFLGAAFVSARAADYAEDFEGALKGWTAVDEPAAIMGDAAPGVWQPTKSPLLDGSALHQTSNAWGDKKDVYPLGTYFVYDGGDYRDFVLEADIFAQDNDGWGLLFRYVDRKNHYRFLTMIDPGNPEFAKPEDKGPWSRFDVRLGDKGDEEPFYERLELKRDTYKENTRHTVKLEVSGNQFSASLDGKLLVAGTDPSNRNPSGKIGLVCFAQNNMWFDNVRVTDVSAKAVAAQGKLALLWGSLKRQ